MRERRKRLEPYMPKGPSDNVFLQQRIPMKQLVYTSKCVIATLALFGTFFIVVGIIAAQYQAGIRQLVFDYSSLTATTCDDTNSLPCLVNIDIKEDIKAPVFFYYTLSNFHQNHRRYVGSRDDPQTRGHFDAGDAPLYCGTGNADQGYDVDGTRIYYYPCGLIARSLFNDTFALSDPDGNAIPWKKSGLSWATAQNKFSSKSDEWLRTNCYRFGREKEGGGRTIQGTGFPVETWGDWNGTGDASKSKYDCWHAMEDEQLAVWMRAAVQPDFWKLHRVIDQDLKAGKYRLEVELNYPVRAFGGAKGVALSNASPFGGKVSSLAAVHFAVGSLCLLVAVAFLVGHIIRPDPPPMPAVAYPEVEITEGRESMSITPTVWTKMRTQTMAMVSFAQAGNTGSKGLGGAATGSAAFEKRRVKCPAQEGEKFANNFVSTTKYTMITFLPKNLFIQFQRFANCYFLGIAILASIKTISPVSGDTFIMPLALVICFTVCKDAYEDYQRYKSDIEENSRICEIWTGGDFKEVPWRQVTVGSLVRVTTNHPTISPMIPSDLTLLASSAPDGTCFLETANLDGETNLKLREATEVTQKKIARGDDFSKSDLDSLSLEVVCPLPDAFLYDFNARMEIDGRDVSLSGGGGGGGQFLQRSTKLRNTRWVIGVAVYTGKDTKIQMNMSETPNKVSAIERSLNLFIPALFVLVLVFATVWAIMAGNWVAREETKYAWYLDVAQSSATLNVEDPTLSGFISLFTFIVLISLLIPISLYVSLEFTKIFIAIIISGDREMWAEEEDIPSLARSYGLCEELGQVTYIFSDKTGTLTQNLMEFRKMSIAGIEYGRGYCEVERAIARKDGRSLPPDPPPPPGLDPKFKFVDERILFGRWRELPAAAATDAEHLLLNLSLNHNVQVEFTKENPTFPIFQAESPDEGAFVEAARNFGYYFHKRDMKEVTVRISKGPSKVGEGEDAKFTMLNFNQFDNNRKRTSTVVRMPDGRVLLLVKGADACVMPFIDTKASPAHVTTQEHIDRFSEQGLRTLLFAGRFMTEEEYTTWNDKYVAASLLSEGREAALKMLAAALEEGHDADNQESYLFNTSCKFTPRLLIHGVSALEDKLQQNVGDCIAQLAKAMIKIWVLTGDKLETAINIGYATALLGAEMEPLLRISQDELMEPMDDSWKASASALELKLEEAIRKASDPPDTVALDTLIREAAGLPGAPENLLSMHQLIGANEIRIVENRLKEALLTERVKRRVVVCQQEVAKNRPGGYALVIDGPCLRAAMQPEVKMDFLRMGIKCKSVVCCRVTPSQKAQVTLLVKDNVKGQITLAIGDGANDVSMIQAAHIGVGIRGKEGQQAVLASDYALPRFSYLERLLLVHGRWCYNRIGTFVCYFFYKTICFALTAYWFSTANAYSGTQLFYDGTQALYNVFWTSFPVIFFGILDRDLEDKIVRAHPELYSTGQFRVRFTGLRFAMFIIGAVLHSILFFFGVSLIMDHNTISGSGHSAGMWSAGETMMTVCVVVVNIVISLHTRSWSIFHVLVYGLSVLFWFAYEMIFHSFNPGFLPWGFDVDDDMYGVFPTLAGTAAYWLIIIVIVAIATLPILAYKYFREHYYPAVDDYWRRVVQNPSRFGLDPTQSLLQVEVNSDTAAYSPSVQDTMRGPSEYSTETARTAVEEVSVNHAPPSLSVSVEPRAGETRVEPFIHPTP